MYHIPLSRKDAVLLFNFLSGQPTLPPGLLPFLQTLQDVVEDEEDEIGGNDEDGRQGDMGFEGEEVSRITTTVCQQ